MLAFHDSYWDPARRDEIAAYGGSDATTVLIGNDDPVAAEFGVAGEVAVFVIDADGSIAWRHVAGLDASLDPAGARLWNRREFVAAAIGAAVGFFNFLPSELDRTASCISNRTLADT